MRYPNGMTRDVNPTLPSVGSIPALLNSLWEANSVLPWRMTYIKQLNSAGYPWGPNLFLCLRRLFTIFEV
jgi:hypothetical protein